MAAHRAILPFPTWIPIIRSQLEQCGVNVHIRINSDTARTDIKVLSTMTRYHVRMGLMVSCET